MRLRVAAILLAIGSGMMSSPAFATVITLTQIATKFNNPIGIDTYTTGNPADDSVVISVNYPNFPSAAPNFERILVDGSHVPFGTIQGFSDEVKIATVQAGNPHYPAGTLFTGNGVDGQIVRINPDGTLFGGLNPWVTLAGKGEGPGPFGLLRGSLYVDRTGLWDYNLVVVTTRGEMWEIPDPSVSDPIRHANITTIDRDGFRVPVHLEGLITVPNDPRYGPLAGLMIAGAENLDRLYAVSLDDLVTFFDLPVGIEDIDLITPGNFYGVNFGTMKILGAPASQFASIVGDILLTEGEFYRGTSSRLHRLSWDGSKLVTEELKLTLGSAEVGQWEHVTFSTAALPFVSPPVPEPSTLLLLSSGLVALVGATALRRCWRS